MPINFTMGPKYRVVRYVKYSTFDDVIYEIETILTGEDSVTLKKESQKLSTRVDIDNINPTTFTPFDQVTPDQCKIWLEEAMGADILYSYMEAIKDVLSRKPEPESKSSEII